jgi:hypothetical protein
VAGKAAKGFCTQIGNAHFAWFGTTSSGGRLNFLALLRAGYDDYIEGTRREVTLTRANLAAANPYSPPSVG